jgi:hypothetical protein
MLIAEVFTYSRDAWLGCVLVVLLLARHHRRRTFAVSAVLVAATFFVGPVHRLLAASSSASTEPGHNTYYRIELLKHAFEHASVLGHPFSDLQTAIPNFPDVTSLLASTALHTGLIGVLELAVIASLAIIALVDAYRRGDEDYRAGTAALVAQLVGLTSVNLITNYQFFFWALVAFVATRWTHRADVPSARNSKSSYWVPSAVSEAGG